MKKITIVLLLVCFYFLNYYVSAEEKYIEYPIGVKEETRDFLVVDNTNKLPRGETEFDCTRNYDKGVVVATKVSASKMHPIASQKWRKTSAYHFTYEDESKVAVSVKVGTGNVSVMIGFAKWASSGGNWQQKANSKKYSKPKMHTKGTVKKYTYQYYCSTKYTYTITHESASIVYE